MDAENSWLAEADYLRKIIQGIRIKYCNIQNILEIIYGYRYIIISENMQRPNECKKIRRKFIEKQLRLCMYNLNKSNMLTAILNQSDSSPADCW